MKTKPMIVFAAAFGLAGAAYAQDGNRDRPHRELPPEVIGKFDKDGDGKLNEEERKAARAEMGPRKGRMRKEMLEKFDADGDGKLSDDEKAAMKEAHRKRMLEKYDKDGDGELSEEEETAMKEERKKMMLEKFDKDGDGKLSDEEKAEARKAMHGHGPGGPRGGKRKAGPGKGPDVGGVEEAPGAAE